MRAVVQRVRHASVEVDGEVRGEIGAGLLVLVGTTHDDDETSVAYLADKIVNLRIFDDRDGKMNLSCLDLGHEILAVSQFTLYANTNKGRRPSFVRAQQPKRAKQLYHEFLRTLRQYELNVGEGVFGAIMEVKLVNWGPVTLLIDSERQF